MNSTKIETTVSDLQVIIGLAAEALCEEEKHYSEDAVTEIAAKIAVKATRHFTGEEVFPEEDIELCRTVINITEQIGTFVRSEVLRDSVEEEK